SVEASVDSAASVLSAADSTVVSAGAELSVVVVEEPQPARVPITMEAASTNARYFFFIIISSRENRFSDTVYIIQRSSQKREEQIVSKLSVPAGNHVSVSSVGQGRTLLCALLRRITAAGTERAAA